MWISEVRGEIALPVETYARVWGIELDQAEDVLRELIDTGVAESDSEVSVTRDGKVTQRSKKVTLRNRRMCRERKDAQLHAARQLKYRVTQTLRKSDGPSDANVTPPSSCLHSSSSSKATKNIKSVSGANTHAHEDKTASQGNGKLPAGLLDHPAVVLYWESFRPERLPSIGVQEKIASTVGDDVKGWRTTITFWRDNGYRAESIGKMLDRYEEEKRNVGGVQRIVGGAAVQPGKYDHLGKPER